MTLNLPMLLDVSKQNKKKNCICEVPPPAQQDPMWYATSDVEAPIP